MIKGVEHHYTYYEKWFGSPVGLHMHPASRKVPTFVLDLNQNNTEALTTVHSQNRYIWKARQSVGCKRCVTPAAAYNNNLLHSMTTLDFAGSDSQFFKY